MKLLQLVLLLLSMTSFVATRSRRRLLLRRQSSYNKFMRSTALNFEKAKVETLGAIFKRHVQQLRHTPNKQVELVFLIDSSGSVGSHYFYEEVRFVKNLLADFTVDMNSTRVSVITFSSPHKIFRYIDYLSEPSIENHKCRLLEDDIPEVDYTAGGTHTLGAFLEAEKVLRSARADATKAIFLMTDGYSNGGDPRPIAHKLKAQGVQIFTFGIRDGFVWELQDMASEPKNETCYILDSFEEFEALAKRALHTDLQSGSFISQSLSKCGKLCNNGGVCCHPNASCSCGTYSGKYKCLCKAGYYGSGVGKTGCKPCPAGTYKKFTGLGACTPCPDKHQMTPVAANSLSLCKCKKGYRDLGSQECTVFRCPKLAPPKHGIFVNNKCNNVFNAACGLKCKIGYELHGSSLRICQENGEWSGQPAKCIMKTCPSLPKPKNGHMICSTNDFSYSTVCRFTCNTGYQLVGSRKRTCLAIAFWTGIATICREITCPPLVEIKDGTMEPASCLSNEVVFGTTCQVSCRSGYKLKGPHTRQCTPDGTWMASEDGANLCLDESPPILHCPKDIEVSADEEKIHTEVIWTEPVPIDNSGLRPVITSEPYVSSGTKFPMGKTTVVYRTKDLSDNVAECEFTIQVIDKTPPRVDKCVSPPPVVSKAELTAIKFEEPQFSDNSGKPVEVAPSRRLDDLYPMGRTKIVFTAFDPSNNNNTCIVDVDVIPHLCMTPEPPANGNITCKKGEEEVICEISCEDGFAFAEKTATEFRCILEEGGWMPAKYYPFQDCSAVQDPSDIHTPASITLTSDNISCKDKQMLSEIVGNLEEEMKDKLREACKDELSCRLGDLSFICEDGEGYNQVPQIVNKRRRRSVSNKQESHSADRSKLSLQFSLSGSLSNKNLRSEELENELNEALKHMLVSMKSLNSQTLDVQGKPVAIEDMLYDINDPEYQCQSGSILSNKTCVSCPAGTFCSPDQNYCGRCPRGTYQDKESQTECIRCPDDKSTDMENCRRLKDCKALCRPGSFSPTGLEPCETCHHGFYQSDFGSRMCHTCGEGKTTPRRGSVSSQDCAELCPSGYASRTGLSPCYPCPSSGYQPKVGQMECLKCPRGGSTSRIGAIYLSQCVTASDSWEIQADAARSDTVSAIPFNVCDFENPCQNDGVCQPKDGGLFSCTCAPGFDGETCGETVEPCKSSPCLNNGNCYPAPDAAFVCECSAGFTGKSCEENIDDCVTKPCENGGVCVDRINSFYCNCPPGFTGITCGSLSDNCDTNPCLNGGSCSVDESGVTCGCPAGFTGELCEEDVDECLSLPCQNDATCVDQPGGYSCTCLPGYLGKDCEEDFDECMDNPCINGGSCVDGFNDFTCTCANDFTGKRCEVELNPYYQLEFADPSILDYAETTISQSLTAVTASFYMKTTDDDNQGTPFSYAVKDEPDAFTITDYKNLNIYINGEEVSADLRLNDGTWQHVVFTWSSPRGDWKIYVNGVLIDQGYDLSTKKAIPANGAFIIGQEQDEEGGGFSVGETFLGSMTQLNVWDRELSLEEIERLRYSCQGFEGNVVAWSKIQFVLKGGLTKSPSPFCEDCPKPEAPASGSVTFTGVRPDDDVVYICDEGYNAAGRSEFKCLVTGEWESYAPDCQPVSCGHPGSIDHGYIIGRDFSYGSRVRFRCNRGYELDGPQSVYCNKYEEWVDDVPECVEIQCEIPLLSVNTISSVTSRYVKPGTTVTFSCTPGNKLLSSHDSSLCQIDGTFDKSVPTCDPERCPTPPIIDNGEPKEIKEDYGVGETVQYQCLYGYFLDPDVGNRKGSINCLPSGQWEDDLPECREILCPDPIFVQNAEAVGEDRFVDAEVTYQCKAGYEGVGKNAIRCQETGDWTRLRMRCRPLDCGDPPPILFGSFIGELFSYGSTVLYLCDQGYVLQGNKELSCGEDAKWLGIIPECQPISCDDPDSISNGKVTYTSLTFSNLAEYSCDPGFVIAGAQTVTCEANGEWTPGFPSCNPQACPAPPDVDFASYESPPELVFKSTVTYTCNTGLVLSGAAMLVCGESGEWTPGAPTCESVTCPKPAPPKYGSVSAKGLSYSSLASYSCDQGFKLVGVGARMCQVDGTWSDDMPICQPSTCLKPEIPPLNGRFDYKDLAVGSIVTYSCDKGYKLVGDSVRRCQPDLTLDGATPVCNPVDCGALLSLENGDITFSTGNTLFGTTATFTCDPGFFVNGSDNIYCGTDGRWSEQIPGCKPVECPKVPKVIQNGRVTGSSFSYGSVLVYECNEGYRLNGQAERKCQIDTNWDNPAPSCEVIICPPARLAYGILSNFDRTVGTTVQFSCRNNYKLEGPKERTCLPDGNWSGINPKCLRILCDAPNAVDHAESKVVNLSAIEYTCNKGFDLVGSSVRVCDRDKIWRPDAPKCVPGYCQDLAGEIFENGLIIFSSAKIGERVEYACNPGYKLKGKEKRKCLRSGLWEGDSPSCEKLDCGHPGIVPNGNVVGSDFTFGATVKFECNIGYKQNGAQSIRCEETGYWENLYPNCVRVTCPDPDSDFKNGDVYFDSTYYLSFAEYVCKTGFILKGPKERECLNSGEWSDTEPACVPVVCPTPEVVKNGIIVGGKDSYGYGDEISYTCEEGYYQHGKPSRQCTKEAAWTEWIPKCYSIQCPEPPYLENGNFRGDSAKYKSVLTFYCFEGYRLVGDEEITCQEDGQWSGSGQDPRCERISCGVPPSIDNAYPDQTDLLFYDSLVKYSCNEGYTNSGNEFIKCLSNSSWSYTDFSCTIISCPAFSSSDVPHSIFQPQTPSFNYKDTVAFTCEEGYRLSGESVVECQLDAAWSSALPSCTIIQCPPLGIVESGSVSVNSNDFGSIALISCYTGYVLKGSSSLICLSSGLWNDSLPLCEAIACPKPPDVVNGVLLNPDGPFVYEYKLEYACDFGYKLLGSNILTCTEFGTYDNPAPTCQRIGCPEVKDILFGKFEWVNQTFLLYTCNSGFNLEGVSIRECVLGGVWGSEPPVCHPVPCPSPPTIDNGKVIGTIFTFGNFVEYQCNKGHNLIGSPISVCQEDGTWSERNAQCLPVNCGEPEDSFENGYIEGNLYTYLETINYVCMAGFELKGHNYRTCRKDGEWSRKTPACIRQSCDAPDAIPNGSFYGDSFLFESVISYNCSQGFTLVGEETRVCESFLSWSGSNPVCVRVSCPTPEIVPNGYITGSSYLYEDTIQISCNKGYRLEGSDPRTCQADRSWSGVESVCVKIYCPVPPPELKNSFSEYEQGNVYGVDDFVTYFCGPGYLMNGTGQKICESSGKWSSNFLQCYAMSCPEVTAIENGGFTSDSSENPFTFPASLFFTCNQGFSLVGSPSVECRPSGWSSAIPSCSIIECEKLQIEHGSTLLSDGGLDGKFVREEGRFYAGDSVLIECNPGYEVKGFTNTTCSFSGKWKSGFGSCQRVQCPQPTIENGDVVGSSYLYEDTIQISCNKGYRLEGSDYRTCQADRSWSGGDSVCVIIYCPVPPPELKNSFSEYEQGNVYGVDDFVTYFCGPGYIMNGTGQQICESSGKWSSNYLQCYAMSCPEVTAIENGGFTSDSPESPFTFPASLFFTCNKRFSLVGSPSVECRPSGWSFAIPSCSIIECEKLQIEHGSTLLSDGGLDGKFVREEGRFYAGDSVLIECNPGYEVKGFTNTTCSFSGKWKSGFGSCQRVQCPQPTIENGDVVGSSYLYEDTIQISCNKEYRLEGSDSRTCQADRSWSGVNSVCIKIYCPVPPPELKNSFSEYEQGNVYGVDDFVTYFCGPGYIMNGTGQKICESSGKWSSNYLQCYAMSCPEVTAIENGGFTSDSPESPFTFPASLFFTCNQRFSLVGSPSVKCRPSGWSSAIPSCSIIECENLQIEHGSIALLSDGLSINLIRERGRFYAGDSVSIQCESGYEISGEVTAICSIVGSWSTESYCNAVTCLAPEIKGGLFSDTLETFGSTITVSCDEGLDLIGTDELTCGADTNWIEALPRCELLACGSPSKVEFAVLMGESFNLGDTVFYQCKPGYDLVGNNILTCGPNNLWLGSYPVCVKVDCGQPIALPDSYMDFTDTFFQSTATIYCLSGYELEGNDVIVCGPDRQWQFDSSSQCSPVDCGDPPTIPNGFVSPDGTTLGSLAVYTCDAGHVIEGASSMYCDEDGQWAFQTPICAPVSCLSDPPDIAHASYSKNGYLYRDVVQYTCDKGYTFSDANAATLECGDMGFWKGDISDCIIIDCGPPPQFKNAFSKFDDTTYSSIVSFYCVPGYERSKSNFTNEFMCGDGGTWGVESFLCTKKNCLSYPDLVNGEYLQGSNGTLYLSEVSYNCFQGYEKTGPDLITCTSDGKWTSPYCAAVDCSDPSPIPNGQYELDSTTYESEGKYSCNAGYVLAGTSTIECLDTGRWTPTLALCKPLNCNQPPTIDNSDVDYNTTLYKDTATYSCGIGYKSNTPTQMTLSCGDSGQWIGVVPKCEIVTCPEPESPFNGFVNYSEINYLSKAVYGCHSGNKLIGSESRTCQENGIWSHEAPTCFALQCSQPDSIDNGKVTVSSTHFGSWAYYSCLEGFVLEGQDSLYCDENGSWNSSTPACNIIDCRIPPLLEHGHAQYDKTTFYSKASYVCNKGYSLVGNEESTCQVNGQWSSDEKRECKLIVCPQPIPHPNSHFIIKSVTFGSQAIYRCFPGYSPQTASVLTCDESGRWEGQLPACFKQSCSEPGSIDNGGFFYEGPPNLVDTVVEYFCEKGYNLIGENRITCISEPRWSSEAPYCKPVTCPTLTQIPYSIIHQEEEATFMSVATFQCEEGYSMVNQNDPGSLEAVYICNEDGQWKGDGFECRYITCQSQLPHVANAKYELTNSNRFASQAIYTCNAGYIIYREYNVVCDKFGQWSVQNLPECDIVSCGLPPPVEGASYKGDNFNYGSAVTYSCLPYHRLVGDTDSTIVECMADGTWMPLEFGCQAVQCHVLTVPENGGILNDSEDLFVGGSVLKFACKEGFVLIGSETVTCLESGQWNLPSPVCQKVIGVCEESIAMDNAVSPPPGKFHGDEIVVECKEGYQATGLMTSTCQHDGSWPAPSGLCSRVSCGRPDTYDRQNVRVFGRSFLYGDRVRYMCRYGFSPIHNPPVLECLAAGEWDRNASCIAQCKQTCQNGGRCLGLNRCKCMPGWAGFKCHLPICIFRCLNGGQCEGPYKCKCPAGYMGSRCERAICPRLCQNGGRCLRPGKCHCLPGYQGSACEDKILSANG